MKSKEIALAFGLPYVLTVSKPVQPSKGHRVMQRPRRKVFQRFWRKPVEWGSCNRTKWNCS